MSQVKVKLYNEKAEETGEEKLDAKIFGIEAKPELIHQVVVSLQHNSREAIAHAKGRGEVRGGGKKPWKQKGTGRARAGSSRSPIWIGGGVTFGPSNERNFSVKINKKMKQKALFMCLSDRIKEDNLILIDKIDFEKIKTKEVAKILNNVDKKIISKKEIKDKKKPSILMVLDRDSEKVYKAARNIENIGILRSDSLNIVQILKYKYLLTTASAVKNIEEVYGKK